MGGIDVATVVVSILAAFNSGLDVFHRLGGKKRKQSSARLPRPSEEEEWTRQSLTKRQSEIKHEYERSVSKHGSRFETGDGRAHSRLAHTLVVLNTGLVTLLNNTLSGDGKSRSASQKALYNLSESAALDTMAAFGDLNSRLSLIPSSEQRSAETPTRRKKHERARREVSSTQQSPPRRPSPSPLLERGGWARTKSGSTVVSAVQARRAIYGDGERHRRHKSESTLSTTEKGDRQRRNGEVDAKVRNDVFNKKSAVYHGDLSKEVPQQRPPTMLLVSADVFRPSPGDVETRPMNHINTLHKRSNAGTRVRPDSTATFLTQSTKIGEIPESRWAEQYVSMEDVESRRIPYTIPPPLEPPKRVGRGLKFWKKVAERPELAAY